MKEKKKRNKTKQNPPQQSQLQSKLIVRGQILLPNLLASFLFISIGLINTCIPPASDLPKRKAGRQSINMSYKESALVLRKFDCHSK